MKYALIFLFFLGISSLSFSQNTLIRPKPEPAIFVNDYAGLLSHAEIQRLEEKLVHFDKTTTNQLAIVILPSLEGNSIEALANEWFKAWGIGQKDKNNGLLVLVAQKDRKMRIEVGYGLNTTITDIEAQKVIENQLKPNFRNNQFFKGLDEATTYLMGLAIQKFPIYYQEPLSSSTSNQQVDIAQQDDTTLIYQISAGVIFVMILFLLLRLFYFKGEQGKLFTKSQNHSSSSSYQNQKTASKSSYYHNNTDHNTHASTYYYYSSNYTSSDNSDTSSSDSGSSYGGGDSGGDGAGGDW